jgi:hypothetical protein
VYAFIFTDTPDKNLLWVSLADRPTVGSSKQLEASLQILGHVERKP